MSSNLTPLGSDGGFNTTGNVVAGNVLVVGNIGPSGDASPAPSLNGFDSVNSITVSAFGNITGGNIVTSGSGGDITLTGGNITGANVVSANTVSATVAANVNSINISQSIRWDYSGSEIYEDGGLVINGPGGVFAQGNIAARFEFNDGLGNSGGLYSDIGNSLVYSVGNVIVRSNNLSQTDWTFGTDGNLSIPGGGAVWTIGQGTAALTANIQDPQAVNLGLDYTSNTATLAGNSGVYIQTNSIANTKQWAFGTDGNLNVPGHINNLSDPVLTQDAATKAYVDQAVTAFHTHAPAYLGTTTDLATWMGISSGDVVYTQPDGYGNGVGATLAFTGNTLTALDGVTLVGADANTRLLIKNEANAVLNGLYTYTSDSAITRATDEDQPGDLDGGDFVFIQTGDTQAATGWVQTTVNVVIGTSDIVFNQFSGGGGTYTANTSAGISLTGTVFSAKVDGTTIVFNGGGNISIPSSVTLTTPNIGAATGTSLSTTGNVTGAYILGNGSQLTGLPTSYTNLSVTNITVTGNVIGNTANIYANTLSVVGNTTSGNLLTTGIISATGNVTGNYFIGNGSQLTNINGSNVTGNVSSATTAYNGNVTTVNNNQEYRPLLVTNTSGNLPFTASTGISWNPSTYALTAGKILLGSGIGAQGVTGKYAFGGNTAWAVQSQNGTGTDAQGQEIGRFGSEYTSGASTFWDSYVAYYQGSGANSGWMILNSAGNAVANITGLGVSVTGTVSASGNVTGGNILTGGLISATGNATVGNIIATNIGNIASINLNGNASTVLYGNGVFSGVAASYGNSNVNTLLATWGSNTISTTGTIASGNITATNITANATTAVISTPVNAVGYIGTPLNSQSSNYQLVIGDMGKSVYMSATATVTVPDNANVAYPIGTVINLISGPSATTTVNILGSDTIYLGGAGSTGSRTISAYGMGTILKVTSTTWYISGAGVA